MKLSEFYNQLSPKSDKGTEHDYINGYYCAEFTPRKNESIRIMEIGVLNGESINLWNKYFENAMEIAGVDINITNQAKGLIEQNDKVILENENAYSMFYVHTLFDNNFDYIIDDGPHTLQSQNQFIELYYAKIKKGGKLIIEDIQSKSDLESIEQRLKELKYKYKVFDLTANKGRYDDIIIEITK
jgi:hypothetical protein